MKVNVNINFIRGIALILMLAANFFALGAFVFFPKDSLNWFNIIYITGGIIFIAANGLNSYYSKSNREKGVTLLLLAVIYFFITFLISSYSEYSLTVFFGLLALLAVCKFLSDLLKKPDKSYILLISVLLIALGVLTSYYKVNFDLLAILNFKTSLAAEFDFFPFLPFAGVYFIAMYFGSFISGDYEGGLKSDFISKIGKHGFLIYFVFSLLFIGILFAVALFV